MSIEITADYLLDVAADHIKAFGWADQNDHEARHAPQPGRPCDLRGSLKVAIPTIVQMRKLRYRDYVIEFTRAMEAAEEKLALFIEPMTAAVDWEARTRFLNRWNDQPGRTQAEVETALRGAARSAR